MRRTSISTSSAAGQTPVAGASAFTLVELLVVIGIIGLLISILLPALNSIRRRSQDIACASNLRQLVTGCTMYLNERRSYPEPVQLAAFGGPAPLAIDERLLNQLSRYLNWPAIDTTVHVPKVPELPKVAVCNLRFSIEGAYDYSTALGNPYWNTGYSYCAGVGQTTSAGAKVLAKDRIADLKGLHRGVLWADTMFLSEAGPIVGWVYFHTAGPHQVEPVFASIPNPTSYRGHHRAWSDGSVDFIRRNDFSLNPADADTAAAYSITAPPAVGLKMYAFW